MMKGEAKSNYIKLQLAIKNKYGMFLMAHVRKCSVCGKKHLRLEYTFTKEKGEMLEYIKEHQLCFECGYWLYLSEHKPTGFQVADGVCYKILPFIEEPTLTMLLGSKAKKFFFVTKEREIFKSNDVWRIGKVPERFRDLFPDTGWFCDKNAYGKLLRLNKMCKEVGCLDRYKCFRFNTQLELKNGPYNTVPKNWVTGGERCGFFINTELIKNYVSPLKNNE